MWRADSQKKLLLLGKIEAKGEEGGRDEIVEYYHQFSGHELGQTLVMVRDRGAWHAAFHGLQSQTKFSDWKTPAIKL